MLLVGGCSTGPGPDAEPPGWTVLVYSMAGELTADPAGVVVPEVLTVGPDGEQTWTPTTDVGLYADLPALRYDLPPLPAGSTLYAELTVTDFAGNSDTVTATVTVP